MKKYFLGLCQGVLIVCLANDLAAQNCTLKLEGKVTDAMTHQVLAASTISILPDKATYSDANGNFHFPSLCPGIYDCTCSHVGYKKIIVKIKLSKDGICNFKLEPEAATVEEVVISNQKKGEKVLVSQSRTDIQGLALLKVRGQTLGESLREITGVATFQSGPSIFKPVIHGLHSNRILIFNNGVRQEGQQWGSEHAPEIDPFVATRLSVVKGAESIRYGSDAIGGVVLVEPAEMPVKTGVGGEANIIAASNNRMGVASGILQGAFDKKLEGLSWRAQGTYRKAGNSKTPDYYLDNTGFQEINYSSALSYRKKRFDANLYYSEFNTKLGIFSGTHAETIADFQTLISYERPLVSSKFSYDIDRPYQDVRHDLFKADVHYDFTKDSKLEIVYARQRNIRSEYDYIPLSGRLTPELYLSLISHTVDVVYKHKLSEAFSGILGFNGITQGNVRKYEMLIPNFRNYSGGFFYIGKWKANERLTLEAGARYDYSWLRAYTLDQNTAQVVTPLFIHRNVTGTIGSQYFILPHLSWIINAGTAWRAPSVNELLSQGIHQSAVTYELGNPNLKTEKALNIGTSLHYQAGKVNSELGFYNNAIDGYVFLKPTLQFIHTVRGSYPTYAYTQVNAIFRGVDLSASLNMTDALKIETKASFLYAWNKTINNYLQQVPSDKLETALHYDFKSLGFIKEPSIGLSDVYNAKQTHVPANSDYLEAPPAYTLVNMGADFKIPAGKQMITVSFIAANLFNEAYRDYMDRFRYFADEPGRNFTLRLNMPFGN